MKPFKFLSKHKHTESDIEYYETDDYEFFGVTPLLYSPETFEATRFMLFRHRENGGVVKGNRITQDHPMWDFNERV